MTLTCTTMPTTAPRTSAPKESRRTCPARRASRAATTALARSATAKGPAWVHEQHRLHGSLRLPRGRLRPAHVLRHDAHARARGDGHRLWREAVRAVRRYQALLDGHRLPERHLQEAGGPASVQVHHGGVQRQGQERHGDRQGLRRTGLRGPVLGRRHLPRAQRLHQRRLHEWHARRRPARTA